MFREFVKTLVPNDLLSIYRRLRTSILYRGNSVECSACNGQFRTMRDYRMPNREFKANSICPQCGAKSRHRHYGLYLKQRGVIGDSNKRILHFAPQIGIRTLLSQNNGNRYITTDLFDYQTDFRSNLEMLPFGDNLFDVILCSHVLEHVDNDRQAMGELYRVLKPNGWALLQVPMA